MNSQEGLRFAGEALKVDVRAGLSNASLDELLRLARVDRLVPRSLYRDLHDMTPENSEPGYTLSGRYQPEVAYGA